VTGREAFLRSSGVTDAVLVVPAYEGWPALAFLAPGLARQRLLVWTSTELRVCAADWLSGSVAGRVLSRHPRPIGVRVAPAGFHGHDTWVIGRRYVKVAPSFLPWLEELGERG
jgi:hypothetical protein